MLKTAVLVSGGGTNLQALLDASARGEIPHAEIALVISGNPSAYALTRASLAGVATEIVRKEKDERPEAYGKRLLRTLRTHGIDFVVLAGFLTILPENVIRAYERRILNVFRSVRFIHTAAADIGTEYRIDETVGAFRRLPRQIHGL